MGVGGGGERRKRARKCLGKMTVLRLCCFEPIPPSYDMITKCCCFGVINDDDDDVINLQHALN